MARRTYLEETEDPITGEVTILEADTLEQLAALTETAEDDSPACQRGSYTG